MNMILLHPSDFKGKTSCARLTGRRFKHITQVHKPVIGDKLKVGKLGSKMGEAEVQSISKASIDLSVRLTQSPPKALKAKLILSLPRPLMLKRILFAATIMGIKEIHLIHSFRVEKSFWSSSQLKPKALEDNFILGLEQACDTIMPKIHFHKRFKPFVEDQLPKLIKKTKAIVAHPDNANDRHKSIKSPATIIIGPEGGFIDYEIEQFKRAGCQTYGLGKRILRVETAVPILLSRVV